MVSSLLIMLTFVTFALLPYVDSVVHFPVFQQCVHPPICARTVGIWILTIVALVFVLQATGDSTVHWQSLSMTSVSCSCSHAWRLTGDEQWHHNYCWFQPYNTPASDHIQISAGNTSTTATLSLTGLTPAINTDYKVKNMWITAPSGRNVELTFLSMQVPALCAISCTYAGMEIKVKTDPRMSGIKSVLFLTLISMHFFKMLFTTKFALFHLKQS